MSALAVAVGVATAATCRLVGRSLACHKGDRASPVRGLQAAWSRAETDLGVPLAGPVGSRSPRDLGVAWVAPGAPARRTVEGAVTTGGPQRLAEKGAEGRRGRRRRSREQ